MRILRIATIVATSALAACARTPAPPPPVAGTPAPAFTLVSQNGKPASLKDYRGKWVVLYFYPSDFTRGGTLQAKNFQQDLAKYNQANAVVVGVSGNDQFAHRAFAADARLTFTLLADPGTRVSRKYGSTMRYGMWNTIAARNTFIIDPNGRIARVFLDVEPEANSRDVLAALEALQQGHRTS